MSRIGKLPITIPNGVTVTLNNDIVTVKGLKGELSQYINPLINIRIENNSVILNRQSDEKQERAFHGLHQQVFELHLN